MGRGKGRDRRGRIDKKGRGIARARESLLGVYFLLLKRAIRAPDAHPMVSDPKFNKYGPVE